MADYQYAAGRRQQRHRRQTAASENLDWEPRRAESRHSLPYRAREPEIQRPDRRRQKYPSHRPRASQDFLDTASMPAPRQLLPRAATPKARGRRRPEEDDEDDDDSEKERLRGRMRSRSRVTFGLTSRATSRAKSKVKSRPTSRSSQSTDSTAAPTPTRSSFAQMHSVPSAPSLGPSSGSSSEDSDDESSDSDPQERTRTLKERMNGTPDSEPIPNPISRSQSRSRQKSTERFVPEIESPAEDSDDVVVSHNPRIVVKRSMSRHKQAHQSRSPSRAPRHHRRSDWHSEEPASPPTRTPKKYYHSEASVSRKPSFSRSRATSASRLTSKSLGSSSKQSLGNYFQTPALPQLYEKDSRSHTCVECNDRISSKDLTKLKCGHRWCRHCLKRRFKASIKHPQSMPPRCCTSDIIPLKHVNHLFNDDFKRNWAEKFAIPSSRDRNYCPKSKCREWIRPEDLCHHSNGRTSATCRKCGTEICGICFNKWHDSKHCPTDPARAQFLKVAKEGWKRCFNCQAMVELKEGCNHMTCRCGAQFCMICGSKWKACECPPWFNDHLDEEDEFEHVEIPTPMVSRDRLGGTDGLPRSLRPGFNYAQEPQHHRGHIDEDRIRRAHHAAAAAAAAAAAEEDDDEEDDDYLDDMGDMGNTTGHFLGDDYRRGSHGIVPPGSLPAAPLPPATVNLERPKAGANYVSGVKKARGVRGPSMERLADRFSGQRQTFTPNHRHFGQHMPPLSPPHLGMGPPHQAPMVPSPISRRHTMDDDIYAMPFDPRYGAPSLPRRATTHPYTDDFAVNPPLGRRRYRQMEPPRPSELAGLTGPGSGMNRVFEWMNHVDPYLPDNQTVA